MSEDGINVKLRADDQLTEKLKEAEEADKKLRDSFKKSGAGAKEYDKELRNLGMALALAAKTAKEEAKKKAQAERDAQKEARRRAEEEKKAQKAASDAAKAIDQRSKSHTQAISRALITLNQTMELGKKAFQLLSRGFDATIGKSLELRDATDPLKRQWESFTKNLNESAASLGDVMLPVIVQLGSASKPMLENFRAWTKENSKLIQSKLLSFIEISALGLIKTAKAINTIRQGWLGLQYIKEGIFGKDERKLQQMEYELNLLQKGRGELEHLERSTGDVFAKTAKDIEDGLSDPIVKAVGDAEKLEAQLEETARGKDAAAASPFNIDMSLLGKEISEAEEKHKASEVRRRINTIDSQNKVKEDRRQWQDKLLAEQVAHDEKMRSSNRNAAAMMSSEFQSAFSGVIDGTKRLDQAFGDLFLSIAQKFLQAGLLSLFSAILAPLTGGTSLGFGAALGGVFGFNRGGLVPGYAGGGMVGGPSGVDRVPAMLTAGEYVIPKPIVDDIRQGKPPEKANHFSSGGYVTAGGAAPALPPPSIVIGMAASGTELRKIERDHWNRARKRNERNRIK